MTSNSPGLGHMVIAGRRQMQITTDFSQVMMEESMSQPLLATPIPTGPGPGMKKEGITQDRDNAKSQS